MKRTDLIRHLERSGRALFREGGKHTVYKNVNSGMMTAVPRHREIKENLIKRSAMTWASNAPNSHKQIRDSTSILSLSFQKCENRQLCSGPF
jgi:predicted RNA binding protein YcfA (HicA-like mRNA interferase family)